MKKAYFEEDLALIQKYFPGATTVKVRTPFDLTARSGRATQATGTSFRDDPDTMHGWTQDLVWLH